MIYHVGDKVKVSDKGSLHYKMCGMVSELGYLRTAKVTLENKIEVWLHQDQLRMTAFGKATAQYPTGAC